VLFAKPLLFSLEQAGITVFPNFKTGWHFDDKVGQKYLLEAIGAPLIPSYVFYTKKEALSWIKKTTFPKVFKLRGGAGAANVKLIHNKRQAVKHVNKAFTSGFPQYNKVANLKDRISSVKDKKESYTNILKGLARFIIPTDFARMRAPEKGYVYFQEFIPKLKFDYRTKVVNGKCWGYKRPVRKNDFRASGSGSEYYEYGKEVIPMDVIKLSQSIAKKLNMQSVAFDFVITDNNEILLIEASCFFGDNKLEYVGYWDEKLKWHEGRFNPQGWMVESLLKEMKKSNSIDV